MTLTSVQKLAVRIKHDLGIEADVTKFQRTYPSSYQLARGDISWWMGNIGSRQPVSYLLSCDVLEMTKDTHGDIIIYG
jgi:hypothetical protein